MTDPEESLSRRLARRRLAAAVSGIVAALLVGGAAWLFAHLRLGERTEVLSRWSRRVAVEADARKRAVQSWLAERRADAEVMASDPDLVRVCAAGECPVGSDPGHVREHLDNLRFLAGFLGAFLLTPGGEVLLQAEGGIDPCSSVGPMVRRVARERRTLFHDLHPGEDGEVMLGFLAPVFQGADPARRDEGAPVLGVVALYVSPDRTLFPLLARDPREASTVEAYLVRVEGSGVRIVSPVVGATGFPGLPSPGQGEGSAEAAVFELGETEGAYYDYRGERVLAAVRRIPETGWGLVVKVDEAEALAAWRREAVYETALAGAGLLCLGLASLAAWRAWAVRRYRLLLESLRDREESLQALATGSEDVVFVKDLDGRYQMVNHAAGRMLGVEPQAALGRRPRDFLPPEVVERIEAHDREATDRGTPYQGEEAIPVGGEVRTYLSARIPIRDAEGRVRGVAGVLRDITDRKRSEEALARRAQTLAALFRIAQGLAQAEGQAQVLREALDAAVLAFRADRATVFLADPASGDLRLADARNLEGAHRELLRHLPPGVGVAGEVFRSGQVVAVEHYPDHPEAMPEAVKALGAKSLAGVPLKAEGQPLGVLTLVFRTRRSFTPEEQETLAALGHMAGVALERVRARDGLVAEAESRRRAEERLRRLHDSTAGLTGATLFAEVVGALGHQLGVAWVFVSRLGAGGQLIPLAASERGRPFSLPPFPYRGTPCGEVLLQGQAVHVPEGVAERFPGGGYFVDRGATSSLGVPLWDAQGEAVGVLCALDDRPLVPTPHDLELLDLYARRLAGEVERLRGEERLAEAERALGALIETLPGAVYRCGVEARRSVEYVSRGWVGVTGFEPEAFAGGARGLQDLVVPEDRARVWREIQEAVARGRAYEVEYRIHDAVETVRWVLDVGRAVGAPDRPTALEGVLFDYTERRSLEAQLTHSQRMEALGRLAGGVAHDFNNILTAISGYGELLIGRLSGEDRGRRAAEEIVRAADRAADLTRQLLAFSRKQVVEPRVVDVGEAVRGVGQMLGRILGENLELRIEVAPGAGAVRADPSQLEQVLLNLTVNARDAMPQGGVVGVFVERLAVPPSGLPEQPELPPGEYVVVRVEDTGDGIPPEVLEHIFEPFFTTKPEGQGTGLGLSTVYGIVNQAGGAVTVASEVGGGTVFTVYWPRVGAPSPSSAPALPPGPRAPSGRVVLLAEDEASVRSLAQEHLEEEGYAVRAFAAGDEAAAALPGVARVDVLLTDVVMPGLSGVELARRARERWPDLPVVFISGHVGDGGWSASSAGKTAFLQKPFRLADLEDAVRRAAEGGAGTAGG